MFDPLVSDSVAVLGSIALICLAISPLFHARTSILIVQLVAGLGFAGYYYLLDMMAPCLVTALGSLQTISALFAPCSKAQNKIGYALIPLMVAAAVCFWIGPISALAVTGMVLIALGRMQRDQVKLRVMILAGGALWAVHDFLASLWIVLAADLLSLTIGLVALATIIGKDRQIVTGPQNRRLIDRTPSLPNGSVLA